MPVLNWGFDLFAAVNGLPEKTPMELLSLRDESMLTFFSKVRRDIYTYQKRMRSYERFYLIEMVPENGSLLLGWRKVSLSKRQSCREYVEKMLGHK